MALGTCKKMKHYFSVIDNRKERAPMTAGGGLLSGDAYGGVGISEGEQVVQFFEKRLHERLAETSIAIPTCPHPNINMKEQKMGLMIATVNAHHDRHVHTRENSKRVMLRERSRSFSNLKAL